MAYLVSRFGCGNASSIVYVAVSLAAAGLRRHRSHGTHRARRHLWRRDRVHSPQRPQPRRVRALHCRRNRDRHDLGAGGRLRAASARVQPCRGLLRASRCPPRRSDRALSRARRRPLVGRPQHAPQRYPGGQDTRRVEAIRPERDVPHLQLQPRGPFRSTPLEGTS